jgi:hypothetical protein
LRTWRSRVLSSGNEKRGSRKQGEDKERAVFFSFHGITTNPPFKFKFVPQRMRCGVISGRYTKLRRGEHVAKLQNGEALGRSRKAKRRLECTPQPTELGIFLEFGENELGDFLERVEHALTRDGDGLESRLALDVEFLLQIGNR